MGPLRYVSSVGKEDYHKIDSTKVVKEVFGANYGLDFKLESSYLVIAKESVVVLKYSASNTSHEMGAVLNISVLFL